MKKRLLSITLIALFILVASSIPASAHQRCRARSRSVAARSYYAPRPYYRNARSYYAPRYYRGRRNGLSRRTRAILTIAAPAAIGAGLGALVGGGKGAGVGALLGGGGGAAYYLIKNRRSRRY
ncbi:MAG: hypothetical protein AB1631_06235 [Acidobacteriota bacterium]